jgi:hypothetical protein
MKQETQGKIFVGMIISVLAFGFATGTGIFIGANPLNSIGVLNLTNQGEFPSIYTTPNNVGTTNKANTTQPHQQHIKTVQKHLQNLYPIILITIQLDKIYFIGLKKR